MTSTDYNPGHKDQTITNSYRADYANIGDIDYSNVADEDKIWSENITTVLGFLDVVGQMTEFELADYSEKVSMMESWNAVLTEINESQTGGNKLESWSTLIDEQQQFGDRQMSYREAFLEMGFVVNDNNEVFYETSENETAMIIDGNGQLKEPKDGPFYYAQAISSEIDYLSGQITTQSVRVNALAGKSGDGANHLSSLIAELYKMVAAYVNRTRAGVAG